MAQRENNTMAEGCDKLLKQIAAMEQEPDADMEFLGALRGDILTYLKPPTQSQPQDPTQGPMGQAMGSVMGGAGGAPARPMGGGQSMMASAGPGLPNVDELRRTMGKSSQRSIVRSLLGRMPSPI